METIKKLIMIMLVATATVLPAACGEKDSEQQPADTTSAAVATTPESMVGTVWHATPRYTYTDANGSYPCDITYDLTFFTDTTGELYLEVLVDGRTFIPEHTFDMTYGYDGQGHGTMHVAEGDVEFSVDADKLTFEFYIDLHNNSDGNTCTVGGQAVFDRVQ